MLRFFKSRAFLIVLGFILVAIFIWLVGPMRIRPSDNSEDFALLGSVTSRLIAIGVVIAGWFAYQLVKQKQASQASSQLAAAVVKQSQGEGRPSADVVQLRERFEEAIAALKQNKRGGHSLYELPWYVIIGAPGSGKTTALVNSGLHFPLEQRTGKGALRGVGGTRNCDWWFTEEAVFLDTAGRYTTQDSDAGADSAGWAEFLSLLKKYRKRRPVNGVILAISAHDLIVQGQAGREAHVAAARRRLNELNKELKINLPVYVLVTKCDLVAGFAEYFDDVEQEARSQVWGVTFPFELTQQGTAAAAFPPEFDALVQRLNERVFGRLEDDHDVRRRAKVFGFPQQLASLRPGLTEFVSDVFESTRFDQRVLLRGVYLTSGTQEGTPIDRLLGAMGRRFATPADVVSPGGRGKAYFIERLLKDVMLAESGLAGVNRRGEVRKAAAQLGSYAAMALVAVLGVLTLSCSYTANDTYLDKVSAAVKTFKEASLLTDGSADSVADRLDALYAVVEVAHAPEPWSKGVGLYQGAALDAKVKARYEGQLKNLLLPPTVKRFEERLRVEREPAALYQYLKAYLMLYDSQRVVEQRDFFAAVAKKEWSAGAAQDAAVTGRLSAHFERLLASDTTLQEATDKNETLVESARDVLVGAPFDRILYALIKIESKDAPLALGSPNEVRLFRRRAGAAFSVDGLFTNTAFDRVVRTDLKSVYDRFETDRSWVLGPRAVGANAPRARPQAVLDLYETDYIQTWQGVLNDLGLAPLRTPEETRNALRDLGGPASPLKALFKIVDAQTSLAKVERSKLRDIFKWGERLMGGTRPPPPGERIVNHFGDLHVFVTAKGDPPRAPIDGVLDDLRELQRRLGATDKSQGGSPTQANLTAVRETAGDLKVRATGLPAGVKGIVTEIGDQAIGSSESGLQTEIMDRYRTEVVTPCTQIVSRGYPFTASPSDEVPLADFARLFGAGQIFDAFYQTNLKPFVDDSKREWRWIDSARLPASVLKQFQAAREIRTAFFPPGAQKPGVGFRFTFGIVDAETNRFFVVIDGTSYRFSSGPQADIPNVVSWPSQAPRDAEIRFELFPPASPLRQSFSGQWALLKLFEAGQPAPESGRTDRFLLTFRQSGHSAEVKIMADSIDNAFDGLKFVRSFRCGG